MKIIKQCVSLLVSISLTMPLSPVAYSQTSSERNLAVEVNELSAVNRGQKLALVVGNSNYPDAPLSNPVNDARAMTIALRELGFTVITRENANLRSMQSGIREFGDKLRAGGVGVFYYAGHGMQIKGNNYLIPIGSTIEREDEVAYGSIDAQAVLDKMDSAGNGSNFMILDACRNNPFIRNTRSGKAGLAQMDAPVGTLVSFATSPGAVASDGDGVNGLYTTHLLDALKQPGLKAEDVFKRVRAAVRRDSKGAQVPWEATSLEGDFYFRPAAITPNLAQHQAQQVSEAMAATAKLREEMALLQAQKVAAEKLLIEKLSEEKSLKERLLIEKQNNERFAAEKLKNELEQAQRLKAEQLASEQRVKDQLAADKAAHDKLHSNKQLADKLAAENLRNEKLTAERVNAERIAAEQLRLEKIESEKRQIEKLAADKLQLEKMLAEKLAAEKTLAQLKMQELALAQQASKPAAATTPAQTNSDNNPTSNKLLLGGNAFGFMVGDTWRYQTIDKWSKQITGNWARQIDQINQDGSLSLNKGSVVWEANGDIRSISPIGERSRVFSPALKVKASTLAAGFTENNATQISFSTKAGLVGSEKNDAKIKVIGQEAVVVPAGKFLAWKIERSGFTSGVNSQGTQFSRLFTETFWYVPSIKTHVASEYVSRYERGNIDTQTRQELTGFALNNGSLSYESAPNMSANSLQNTITKRQTNSFGYTVGDTWRYQTVDKFKKEVIDNWSRRIDSINVDDSLNLNDGNVKWDANGDIRTTMYSNSRLGSYTAAFKTKTSNLRAGFTEENDIKVNFTINNVENGNHRDTGKLKVLGQEVITVPAGSFNAWKIERTGYINGISSTGGLLFRTNIETFWYVPAIKNFVAYENESRFWNGGAAERIRQELTSYSVRSAEVDLSQNR